MKKGYLIALIVLAVLTAVSLTFNAVVIVELMRARTLVINALSDARALLNGVKNDTFAYTVKIDQEIPIDTSIPFNEEVTVPINTTVPVNTTVVVPIDLGVTTYNVEVPINTIFPVDMEVTVPVSQTVDITTAVPLNVEVPIEIPIADTPLVGYLEELDTALARMETRLERPLDGPRNE